MKNTIMTALIAISLTVNSVYANDVNTSVSAEQNATVMTTTEEGSQSGGWGKGFGDKAVIIAATPVVAAGFIVAAVVVAPVYILKKIFN